MNRTTFPALALLLILALGCANFERNAVRIAGTTDITVEVARKIFLQHAIDCRCVTQATYDDVKLRYEQYQKLMASARDAIVAYHISHGSNETGVQAALAAAQAASGSFVGFIHSLLPPDKQTELATQLPQ